MTAPAGRRAATPTPLFAALTRPECYPHPVSSVRVMETHLSWVLLTGEYAYKIKKPLNLGFADFTTLGLRRHYCEEELRLNRRFAPGLYLDVVSIRGDAQAPRIGGEGPVLDYAVKMREFPQAALASARLARGSFGAPEVDALASLVAQFHAGAPPARAHERFGTPGVVLSAALQNFEQMLPLARRSPDDDTLRELNRWTEREFAARRPLFEARQRGGFVRECHGDLHLGNITVLDGRPVPFDCLEFNEELRWIDVMSETAFVAMDLEDRGHADFAWRFLNRYLESTGDYAGLGVLRFYLVYRALVRAKVHLIRSRQPRLRRAEKYRLGQAFRGYLRLAGRYAAPAGAALILAHGLSGCGKTTATQPLLERLGAVRLRSDLERKRLHSLAPLAASGSGLAGGIYSAEATAATYRRLSQLAQVALDAGFPVIIDATSLRRTERESFRTIAERSGAPFHILDFQAPLDIVRSRIAKRLARSDDASEADLEVLEHQLAAREPLTPAEMAATFAVDASGPASHDLWHPFIERLRHSTTAQARVPRARAGMPGHEKSK